MGQIKQLMLTELFEIELFLHLTMSKKNVYLFLTELFEIELFDHLNVCKRITDDWIVSNS